MDFYKEFFYLGLVARSFLNLENLGQFEFYRISRKIRNFEEKLENDNLKL